MSTIGDTSTSVDDDSTSTSVPDSSVPGSPGARTAATVASTQTYPVLDAGAVQVSLVGESLVVDQASTNPGWSSVTEMAEGREVEVTFRNGDARVDFNAEFEDGEIRIRTDVRTDSRDDSNGRSDDDSNGRIDDDSGRSDDSSDGPDDSEGRSGDDSDDRSGHDDSDDRSDDSTGRDDSDDDG